MAELKRKVLEHNNETKSSYIPTPVPYTGASALKLALLIPFHAAKMVLLTGILLPGLILFAPVFAVSSYMSSKRVRQALSLPNFKVKARDIMATSKALAALAFTPVLYTVYTLLVLAWLTSWGIQMNLLITSPVLFFLLLRATFVGLWVGEGVVDTFRTFFCLVLLTWPKSAAGLRKRNASYRLLSCEVESFADSLGLEHAG
jgi:glycerol-3-phosphate O-acyltransferase / dihydroxyacetone phosphate acyltransferase